jgi:peroxiredoxin Q/BCP
MIEPGEEAPDFALPDQYGELVTLSELRGAPVVVYFYPKADTPGCTTQACGVRDHRGDYDRAGARVLGVSPDPVPAVRRFAEMHALDFTLLADANHAVAERYGVWVEKRMYGRTYMGVQRATFVIAADGTVASAFPKVSPKTHDEVVLGALGELPAR